jgi:hypothetical protein
MRKNILVTAVDAVSHFLTDRDELVSRVQALQADAEKDQAARAEAITQAKADVERLREPERRLAKLELERFNVGISQDQKIAPLAWELKQSRPRELVGFERWVVRAREGLRSDRPVAHISQDEITGTKTVANPDEIARWDRAMAAIVQAEVAIRDDLWRLPSAELHRRISEHRQAIEVEFPEAEMADGEVRPGRRDAVLKLGAQS